MLPSVVRVVFVVYLSLVKTPNDFVDAFLWFRISRDFSQFFLFLIHHKKLFHHAVVNVEFDNGILNFKREPPHYVKNTTNADDERHHVVPCNHYSISNVCLDEADVEKVRICCRNVWLVQQLESVEIKNFI